MAKKSVCTECGQSLVDGKCVNRSCSQHTEEVAGSLVPDEIASMDPSQIVDYTGTLGVHPSAIESEVSNGAAHEDADDELNGDADSAKTRMVDDEFYQQIREFFPAGDSGSESSTSDEVSRKDDPDATRSLNLQGIRNDYAIDEFVPPVRDIRFPSDTASLEELRELDSETIEGDEYHIVEKLGEGGYGVVFEAEQVALNRPVAVKVLKPKRKKPGSKSPSRSGTGSGELQRRRDQFLHEAKITARLQHPNIVPLYDFGINHQGQLFYSMKKVERRPWSSVIQNATKLLGLEEGEVDARAEREAISKNVEIFDRVCDAMAYSHAQQIIHRDLKPDNIMIGEYGEVLLIDFGMALDFSKGQPEFSAGGTLVYMAPEMAEHFAKQKEIQLAAQKTAHKLGVELGSVFLDQSNLLGIGKLAKELIEQSKDRGVIELAETLIRLDAEEKNLASKISYASDVYLLGAILYQIAVGHPPHYFPIGACKQGRKEKFQKELWLALRNGFQQYQEVTDPLRISLRNIAIRAMRTKPEDRFQSVEDLQVAIKGFQLEVQSLEMTETGKEELAKSKGGAGYAHLLPALESFRGASELWPESEEAKSLQVETACEYAGRASNKKDFDAGLSILNEYVFKDHQDTDAVVAVRKKLIDGKKRRARNRTLAAVGWFAAVALPIIVWIVSGIQTAKAQNDARIAQQDAIRFQNDAVVQQQEAEKQKGIAEAQQKLAEAQTKEANLQKAEADKQKGIAEAQQKLAEDQTKEAEKQQAEAERQKTIAETQRKLAEDQTKEAEKQQAEADKQTKLANAQKELADKYQSQADELKFDAELSVYNSNVLTIPLDLRTGKLPEVRKKLERLQSAKPQLRNGWEVRYFAKRANVAGIDKKLGDNVSIVDIVAVPESSDSIIVGKKDGQNAVWRMQADGGSTKLDVDLPEDGEIADVSISGDGQWLALAINNVNVTDNTSGNHLWVVNLNDGKRAQFVDGDGVVGSTVVRFSDSKTGIQLVTVEELLGDRGLQQRVQVVTRTIQDRALSTIDVTPVSATTRDLGRVRYIADARWDHGQPSIGLAYQALDTDGNDVFRMETLTPDGATGFQSSKIEIDDFPTAIHVGPSQALYCGYPSGLVDQFAAGNLTSTPTKSNNLNESKIVRLASTDDGRLISGSENGVLVIRNPDHSLFKTLQGQSAQVSALAVGQSDPARGFTMLSGDIEGNVRIWMPETSTHDAVIRKNSQVKVTCATVDTGLNAAAVAATAFGTDKGQVYYFDSNAMLGRDGGRQIGDANVSGNAKFRFGSPFESFDSAFNDFDSMGIVEDHFVLMKDDGTFFSNFIDESRPGASPRSKTEIVSDMKTEFGKFIPLLASVHDKNYFFTTDPAKDDQLLLWKKSGASFSHQPIDLASTSRGRIKRLEMSPNGKWLAVVRQQGRDRLAGMYIVEMYDVSSGTDSIRLAGSTDVFQVGDPAFVGFSPDSDKMILHLHKRAPDRETWVEHWELAGQEWIKQGKLQKVADRKVDLVDWDLSSSVERMVTKANKRFFLVSPKTLDSYTREDFQISTQPTRDRLRTVRPTGRDNKYYVLASKELNLFNRTIRDKRTDFADSIGPIEDARDLRVFGDRAVMLDKNGFHLIDSDLNYVTLLAARENEVSALSLSTGRLAILYSNGLCRIWDVRGEQPAALGKIENAKSVKLSPDGQWAVCQVDDSLQIFPIGSKFNQAKMSIPANNAAFTWNGTAPSRLLVAENGANKVAWKTIDPVNSEVAQPTRKLPTDLVDVKEFQLAPSTENYLAINSNTGLSLWAITDGDPLRLNNTDHKFDDSKLKRIESISFSELNTAESKEFGTRLVVLASDGSDDSVAEPRIYLIANEQPADEQAASANKETRYRVVEIEGAFEKREGRDVTECQFSGDGKSLLQVDEKGISVLLVE